MQKLYAYFIKFICLFYPVKIRRKERDRLLLLPEILKKDFQTAKNLSQFFSDNVGEKSVLMVEPNPYHFELQPGYCKYFQDLGYNVDVIAQPELQHDSSYIRYPTPPQIYYLSPKHQKKALQSSKIKDYDLVFFTTSVLWSDPIRDSYINWLGFEPKAKNGFFLVEHNIIPYLKNYGHDKYLSQKRIFTLAGQYDIPMLNPHYFGRIETQQKSQKLIFSVIINDEKNANLVFDACRTLIKNNISNFQIYVIGRSVITDAPQDLQNLITITGKLKFVDLWNIYEKSDFLIPMLNPEISNHDRYKNGTVTGSWQIMMGFLKPAIIHQDFTSYYRLDGPNSVIYKSNSDLALAMESCINMNQNDYKLLQKNLESLANKIYEESMHNLKISIDMATRIKKQNKS